MIGSNTATARVRLALEGQGQVVRGLQEVQAGVGSLRSAFTSIAGGLSLGAAVGQLVQVQREMDVLNASMITVTGSSRAAGTEMEWIKRFAAQTPYQLNEVTGAFVKMKALGLDASEKALRSYGNTASAMGKDLTQFIEAVADAATGEFERLKEFGIKAKKEGDSVALTFQGVTTRVRNNAADITAYLQAIGNNQFAGAMERRVSTLDGAISNLADSWDELARTVNEAGVGNLIETSVRGATAAISGLGATIRENKTELAVLAGGLGGAALAATLPKVSAGLMIVAGGVKALGLALAANPLVLALLGIGAAVGAAAAYSKVQSGTVESMTRTVKELEALNARAKAEPWDAVLNANVEKRNQQIADLKKRMTEMGQAARDAFALTDPRRTGEVTEEINRIAPVISDATASGLDPKNPKGKPVRDALDRMAMYSAEVQGDFRQLVIDKEAQWAAEALKQELQSNEVESFFRQVEIEAEARWQAQQDRARSEVEEAADRLRAKEVAEWERANEQIAQSLTNSLMQGGRSFRDYLKDLFRTLVLRPIIAPVVAALASMFGGPAAAGQGGSSLGSLSSLQNLLNPSKIFSSFGDSLAFAADSAGQWLVNNTSGYLNQLGGKLMGNAGSIGTAGSYFAGAAAGVGIGRTISGGYSAIGSSGNTAVNAGTIIGAIFGGPVGAAIGGSIGGLVNRAFGRKLKDSGLEGTFGGDRGFAGNTFQFYKGGWFRSDKTTTGPIDHAMRQALADQYDALAETTKGMAAQLALSASAVDGYTRKIRFSTRGLSDDQIAQRLTEEFAAMGDEMAAMLLGTTQYTQAGETASGTLARLSSSIVAANELFETLGTDLYAVGLIGANMASDLASRFGGLDAMTQAGAAYFQAYYSASEQAETITRKLSGTIGDLGLVVPGNIEQFRQLVEAQDLTTEAGRATYAALLQMAPAFADLQAQLQKLAEEAATQLIATFTASGQLVPVLDGAALAVAGMAGSVEAAQLRAGRLGAVSDLLAVSFDSTRINTASLRTGLSALDVQQLLVQASTGTLSAKMTDAQVQALALATGLTEAQVRAGALGSGADDMAQSLSDAASQALGFAGPVNTINRLLGDAASGVLVFGDRVSTATAALDPAQLAVQGLLNQVFDLKAAASGTVVDVAGLAAALRDVDTRTFVATVTGVFELIGQRVRETLGAIASERTAARDAAVNILSPGGLTAAQIRAGIASSMVGLPSSAGVASAQSALAAADAVVAARTTTLSTVQAAAGALAAETRAKIEQLRASITNVVDVEWYKLARPDVVNSVLGRDNKYQYHFDKFGINEGGSANLSDKNARTDIKRLEAQLAAGIPAELQTKITNAQTGLNEAIAKQALAAEAAKNSQIAYIDALQKYSLDSSRAVTQLGRLREETVRYYESQQQLANLMTGTASSLRDTVAAFRFDQLDPAAQLANLQDRYNVAYSMALSTTGETLADYGSQINSLINPLLQKAQEAGLSGSQYSNLVSTVLARAETVADRLDANAPKDYQAESLGLLGQIDSTLAALETGAKSADQLIVDAVNAGRDVTRDGLRAVVAALTGQPVPAFAAGGYHTGGLRIVGENGPELEATGPARIFNAAQTARMLSGASDNNGELVRELQALRAEVSALRREQNTLATQTVVNTGKTARMVDRWDGEGLPVRNAQGEALAVEAA